MQCGQDLETLAQRSCDSRMGVGPTTCGLDDCRQETKGYCVANAPAFMHGASCNSRGEPSCVAMLEWDKETILDWKLINASVAGNVGRIRDALQAGAFVDTTRPLTLRPSAPVIDYAVEDDESEDVLEIDGRVAKCSQMEGPVNADDFKGEKQSQADCRVTNLTPLMHASREGHAAAVAELLQARACVLLKDQDGMQPLHFAARAGCFDTCAVLIKAGAPTTSEDDEGFTPLASLPAELKRARTDRQAWEELFRLDSTTHET